MASFDAKSEKINGEMGFEEKYEIGSHSIGEDGVEESIEPKVNGSGIGDKNKRVRSMCLQIRDIQ